MESSVCATCLSRRRVTASLCGLSSICSALLDEDISDSTAVCWECAALLRKCRRFTARARRAQTVLLQVQRKISCFTSLCIFSKNTYDYVFTHQPDHDYLALSMDVDPLPDTDDTNADVKPSILALESKINPIKIEVEPEQDSPVEATVSNVLPTVKDVFFPSDGPLKKVIPRTWLQINSKGKINKIPIFNDKLLRRLADSKSISLPVSVVNSHRLRQNSVKEAIQPAVREVRLYRNPRDVTGHVGPALLRTTRVLKRSSVDRESNKTQSQKFNISAKSLKTVKKEIQTSVPVINVRTPKFINTSLKNVKDINVKDGGGVIEKVKEGGDVSSKISTTTGRQIAKLKPNADIKTAVTDNIHFKAVLLCEEEMQALREHDRTREQYVKSKFKCETCILGYYEETQLEDHRKVKHTRRDNYVPCDICFAYLPPHRLADHARGHRTLVECRTCGLRAREPRRMWAHVRSEHGARARQSKTSGVFPCNKCGVIFKSWYKRRYHTETAHERPERARCEYCGKSYRSKDILNTHIRKLHQQRSSVPCPTCGRSYLGLENMWAHARLAHGSRSGEVHSCAVCRKTFKSIATYKGHLANSKAHNADASMRRFSCAECNRGFFDKRSVQEHIGRAHGGTKTVQCQDCDKMYSTERQLSRHKKLAHSPQKPPRDKICEHCGKGFTTEPLLIQHTAVHSDVRPYSCHCGSTFRFKAALYTHQRLKKHSTPSTETNQRTERRQNTPEAEEPREGEQGTPQDAH